MQRFSFSAEFDTAPHPRGKEKNAGDQKSHREPRQDRLIDRRRGFKEAKEVAERDFLFLVLKEKGQGEEKKNSDQNQSNHDLVVSSLFKAWRGDARCTLQVLLYCMRARARTSSEFGPVALN